MNQRDRGDNGPTIEAHAARPHPMDDAASFSVLLRRYRKRAGLTQEMLAERAGLGVNTIGNLERAVSQPYRDTVVALAIALGLSADDQVAFAAAADRGRAATIRADDPVGDLKSPAMDEDAGAAPHASVVHGRRRTNWLRLVVARGRRSGMRTSALLIVVILVIAVGVTMVARPSVRTALRGSGAHLKASGSDCGAAGGWPALCLRTRGTPVYALQYLLNGYDPTYNLTVDGVFGPRTRHAVQDFQHRNAVQRDASSIVGAATWTALTGQMDVHLHSVGSGVLALQYLLDHDPGAHNQLNLDGSYGPKTQRALADAERSLGLRITDTVTPAVWRPLLCATISGCRAGTHPR